MKLPEIVRPRLFAGLLVSGAVALSTSIVYTGCVTASINDVVRSVADRRNFSMQPGERVTLSDQSTLLYVKVIADSRCPPDVRCVWAGDAEVAFTHTVGSAAAQHFSLHTGLGARSQDFDGRRLTLVALARGADPKAQLRFDPVP